MTPPPHGLRTTPVVRVLFLYAFFAAAALILTWRFYGSIPHIRVTDAVPLLCVAVACALGTWVVRKNIRTSRIGLDRSQLNPLTAAAWLVLGTASAHMGAIVGGVYSGIAAWVLPQVGTLAAAHDDAPGVALCALAGVAAAVAGVVLERSCAVPPGADKGGVG
ncbi:DUF3180 domain-containing protein [Corynebacterium sp. 13CS0277]|uniref:DUF3180 domain-containing protein n=1 Tax=Corynebacterium sp. 13CS0277 TaxID=2071994 RepID=UPI000D029007|nr:DUF3180 domain-containing protein [Corynebacterium sp. 13CS0277]PRQ11537.1 DUF3180 domain-containing protein [Corynebacterium sp. 13CS0277]